MDNNKNVLHCLGASQEVGRSAFLLETDRRLLLDYGIKIFGKGGDPEYPMAVGKKLDAAIISHAHMDHSGFVPHLYTFSKIRWFATPPTRDLCELLWKDSMKIMGDELPYNLSHFNHALKYWQPFLYNQEIQMGDTLVSLHDAGHIAGSAMVEVNHGKKKILYTGDFKVEETRMHHGAKPVEDVNTLIIDSTYGMKEHPDRKVAEKRLIEQITETVGQGGTALFPAFALGRTQELISLIRTHLKKVPIYVDGMGRAMTEIYLKHKGYISHPQEFAKCVSSVNMIQHAGQRKEATKRPGVIITSAGMMEGGPVLGYLTNLNPNSKIIFTGYTVEGTNGWKLQNKGYVTIDEKDLEVSLPLDYVDLSAHAGRSDLLNFIKHANPQKIVIVHTDAAPEFERSLREDFGYDAVSPKVGDTIEL